MNNTFAIHTFGCKLNFSESSDMARRLRELGWQESEHPEAIIVNSCAVTHAAEKKVRNYVAHLHREHPDARIVVATSESQVTSIRRQLRESVDISIEPCRRDTFPAIALSTAYLHDV